MKDFKTSWKAIASKKEITKADALQLCAFKAMTAKSALTFEDRVNIAYNLVRKAFTPISNYNKLNCSKMHPYQAVLNASKPWEAKYALMYGCLETEAEIKTFTDLANRIRQRLGEKTKEKYSFIFVRKDLPSKEQILVQTSHATFFLGEALRLEGYRDTTEINFVVCGTESESSLLSIENKIKANGFKTVSFKEPDLNNTTTAIASYPIPYSSKGFMREYAILKFEE